MGYLQGINNSVLKNEQQKCIIVNKTCFLYPTIEDKKTFEVTHVSIDKK